MEKHQTVGRAVPAVEAELLTPLRSLLTVAHFSGSIAPMNKPLLLLALLSGVLVLGAPNSTGAEDRKAKVLSDRAEVEAAGRWIYNDLTKGLTEAAKTRKPMLVVVRCLP